MKEMIVVCKIPCHCEGTVAFMVRKINAGSKMFFEDW